MSELPDAAESLDLIQDFSMEAAEDDERNRLLSQYAVGLLRTRGDLVIAENGCFGGTGELFGGGTEGVMLLQATTPEKISDDRFIMLRSQSMEHQGNKVDLLVVDNDGIDTIAHSSGNGMVLATFVELQGVELNAPLTITNDLALRSLLGAIEGEKPEVGPTIQLPQIESQKRIVLPDGVHPINTKSNDTSNRSLFLKAA